MQRHFPVPPSGDPAFMPLADSRMYWPVQYARLQAGLRERFQAKVGVPFERAMLLLWQRGDPGGQWVERQGLPRRAVEHQLSSELVVQVDPCQLLRMRDWRGFPKRQRPSSSAFIWEGEWDLRRSDLLRGQRYEFISDLATHRHDLSASAAFQRLNKRLTKGDPWKSHQQGLLLDTPERIVAYLRVYLGFMDDIAQNGFDTSRGKQGNRT